MKEQTTPRHVAIIMDGNGRWAQQKGLDRVHGHIQGVESLRAAVKASIDAGVEYLTVYAFSTENWGRPAEEVGALMELFCSSVINETPELLSEGVRFRFIGNLTALSAPVQEAIAQGEATTANNSKLTLVIAINYSARWEITHAAQLLAQEACQGDITPQEITSELFAQRLTTAVLPDPDLLIRTSGECRLSNFLLWQLSYSELYFTPLYWPEFDEKAFEAALEEYRGRQRRYGLLTK